MMRLRSLIFPLAASVVFCLNCCAVEQTKIGPPDAGSPASTAEEGAVKVTIGAPRELQETVTLIPDRKCAIDAMKVCRVFGQDTAGQGGDTRTVSLQIPDGPVVSVECRYSSQNGQLVSAKVPGDAAPSGDAEAFLAAHDFCAAP